MYDIYAVTVFISPTTDPKTLCPYCDTRLPEAPSPLLKKLLAETAKKSYPDARPANPLGRRAPLAVFISVCQRHRFESQILPEAEAKGWPKQIDWTGLANRVEQMRTGLSAIVNDPGESWDDDSDEEQQSPRWRCVFWKELMKDVKEKGSRAAAGVRSQFSNFEKSQPG